VLGLSVALIDLPITADMHVKSLITPQEALKLRKHPQQHHQK
jgi:hypothetical protein